MKRKIIKIDENLCNGCARCVEACHEGAIALVDGKARLTRDDYCDGLGDCLPACPTGAITFEEREAAAYDEEAVLAKKAAAGPSPCSGGGCPGSMARALRVPNSPISPATAKARAPSTGTSELRQWPVQLKLVPVRAQFFDGADLLVAADCAAYAYTSFHEDFIKGKVTVIGCPKLDAGDYTEKLQAILTENDIKSLTVVRMEVPCCGGLSRAATEALRASGKFIPWRVVTVATDGSIVQ